jgi:hypothetical protein
MRARLASRSKKTPEFGDAGREVSEALGQVGHAMLQMR